MSQSFVSKAGARQWAWDALHGQGLARAPLPPHGRIPNFVGATEAAARLFEVPPWRDARAIKVNPDSPQRPVREMALQRGILVYVPTPRLEGGFHLLDPQRIPADRFSEAAALQSMREYSLPVSLDELVQFDAIVTGCVAVTAGGKRAGKGAGYSDLEFAILRELGFAPVPVATTVHDAQVAGDFPLDSNDLPLALICTPTRTISVADPPPAPERLEWERLTEEEIEAMPMLEALRRARPDSRPRDRSESRIGGRHQGERQ